MTEVGEEGIDCTGGETVTAAVDEEGIDEIAEMDWICLLSFVETELSVVEGRAGILETVVEEVPGGAVWAESGTNITEEEVDGRLCRVGEE